MLIRFLPTHVQNIYFCSFLQESFDVNNEEHRSPSHHRTAATAAAYHQAAAAAAVSAVAAAANVAGMDYNGGPPQPAVAHAANPFDLDSFDMLAAASSGTFTELDGGSNYRSPHPEAAAGFTEQPGLLGNAAAAAGTSSPMLGSGSAAAPAAGPKKDRSGGQHQSPPAVREAQ